jgi:hypothetical protein
MYRIAVKESEIGRNILQQLAQVTHFKKSVERQPK